MALELILFDGATSIENLNKTWHYTVINFNAEYREFDIFIESLEQEGIKYEVLDFFSVYIQKQEQLKKEYLRWVYDFPLKKVNEKSVREWLAKNGYSFWWGTLLAEKNILKYNSTSVFDSLKLMLLEDILVEYKFNSILLLTNRDEIVKTVRDLSQKLGLKFSASYSMAPFRPKDAIRGSIFLSSLLFLIKEAKKYFLIKTVFKYISSSNKMSVLTFFPNIDEVELKKNRFLSRYWGKVHSVFESKEHVNYVLWYVESTQMSYKEMLKSINILNKTNVHSYMPLEMFISFKKLFFMFFDTFKDAFLNKKLFKKELFEIENRSLNLFHIHKKEWKNSVSGYEYIQSRYTYEMLRSMCENQPLIQDLFYLMEMQGWNSALNSICTQNDVRAYGVIHTIVKPMMLKYFNDSRTYAEKDQKFSYSLPCKILANGGLAKVYMLGQGIPPEKVDKIEAQRFLYLGGKEHKSLQNRSILIILSIDVDESKKLLECFLSAFKEGLFDNIYIKPHPFLDLKSIMMYLGHFPEFTELKGSMSDAFAVSSTVLAASGSSALLESVMNNKMTITCIGVDKMPLLPIDEHPLLFFAHDANSLTKLFMELSEKLPWEIKDREDMLYLDDSLRLWKKLVGEI